MEGNVKCEPGGVISVTGFCVVAAFFYKVFSMFSTVNLFSF